MDQFNEQGGCGAESHGAGQRDFKAQFGDDFERVEARTAEELQEAAESFDKKTTSAEIRALIAEIARAGLDGFDSEIILKTIKRKTGQSIIGLRDVLQAHANPGEKKEKFDIGEQTCKKVLARYFADGEHLLRSNKQFWAWAGTHWIRRDDEQISHFVSEELARSFPGGGTMASLIGQAMTLMRSKLTKQEDVFKFAEQPRPIINVRNGEIRVKNDGSHEFHEGHDPLSYQTHCLDVQYKPDATCPTYDKTILEIFGGDAEMVRHFHEHVGYAIQPVRNIASFWMWHGIGENGKTKLLETIVKHLMGPESAVAIKIDQLEERFATSQLVGKLIAFDDDVSSHTKLPDGILKQISELKIMTAEFKGVNHTRFICYSLPVMLCNKWPSTSDVSHGMQRRARCIPFRQNFEGRANEELFPYIWQHELSGVLNHTLEGLKRLRQRKKFLEPQACLDAKEEWLGRANPVKAFMDEEFVEAHGSILPRSGTYDHYEEWARAEGVKQIVGRNRLFDMMRELGRRELVRDGVYYWSGIALKNASAGTHYPSHS